MKYLGNYDEYELTFNDLSIRHYTGKLSQIKDFFIDKITKSKLAYEIKVH